jgi:hypothetical protein
MSLAKHLAFEQAALAGLPASSMSAARWVKARAASISLAMSARIYCTPWLSMIGRTSGRCASSTGCASRRCEP